MSHMNLSYESRRALGFAQLLGLSGYGCYRHRVLVRMLHAGTRQGFLLGGGVFDEH